MMQIRKRSFFWRLFLVFLVVMLAAMVGLYYYMVSLIKSYVYHIETRDIMRESLEMVANIENNQAASLASNESLLKALSQALDSRVSLINEEGAVVFAAGQAVDHNISAASFRQAMRGVANLTVTSNSRNESFLTVARPVRIPGEPPMVLAVNTPISGVNSAVRDVEKQLLAGSILIAILCVLVAFYFTRKLTTPINKLIRGTEQVGQGRYREIVIEDTTNELHDLAVSFNNMIRRLSLIDEEQKKLDAVQKEFLSDLSHELRTPLTTLEAFLEALRDGMVADEQKKHQYVVALYEETMHLKRLTSDLLQLARIESSHIAVETTLFDPLEIIRNVVTARLPAAREKGDQLVLAVNGELEQIRCDRDHFRQIVTNLINNAIQFTSGGTIRVEAGLEGRFLAVTVADTGIGIEPQELPLIWNRFFKVDKARSKQHQESGLGLSIVKKLVELHHGNVLAESKPGGGSRFCFRLPRTPLPDYPA